MKILRYVSCFFMKHDNNIHKTGAHAIEDNIRIVNMERQVYTTSSYNLTCHIFLYCYICIDVCLLLVSLKHIRNFGKVFIFIPSCVRVENLVYFIKHLTCDTKFHSKFCFYWCPLATLWVCRITIWTSRKRCIPHIHL